LFRKLKEKGFRCTGTVRPNRIEKCPLSTENESRLQDRGSYQSYTDGSILVTQWKDSKAVIVTSNHEGNFPLQVTKRWCGTQMKRISISQPHLIHQYYKHMGGVDSCDRFLSNYRRCIKEKNGGFVYLCMLLIYQWWLRGA
jgi:hypothetical protein